MARWPVDGKLEAARTELRTILRDFPRDTAAAISLVLLADLAIDEGRDTDARAAYQRVGESFPGSWYGPFGLYQAGIIAWAQGDVAAAVADFDTVATRHPSSDDALGARYWSGRGWDRLGDTARARAAWREVVAAEPASYYGFLAAQRLGVPGWRPAANTSPTTSGVFSYQIEGTATTSSPDRMLASSARWYAPASSMRESSCIRSRSDCTYGRFLSSGPKTLRRTGTSCARLRTLRTRTSTPLSGSICPR